MVGEINWGIIDPNTPARIGASFQQLVNFLIRYCLASSPAP